MPDTVRCRKKLIEVALPLEAINEASAREKSIRHGHPSTLHLWWARRPLAAARAVIFSQMVDDPSEYVDELLANPDTRSKAVDELAKRRALREDLDAKQPVDGPAPASVSEPTLEDCAADIERERLFVIIRQLVRWENTTNEAVLQQARDEIWRSWRRTCADNADHPRAKELFDPQKLPAFHDPFAGGGSLPLEAQRLGLEAHASDLNPVAVLINKAMIEIPPKFAGLPPVNPESRAKKELLAREWRGAQGLAEDVRYYGKWMRDEAEKRIGHLYPKVEITPDLAADRPDLDPLVGKKLTVIAWLWARTVKSPNPAFACIHVPLLSTFMLSTRAGKEAYLEPIIDEAGYQFAVRTGQGKAPKSATSGTKLSGANFRCLMSGSPIPGDYIKAEGKAGRIGARLVAMVVEGKDSRIYLPPTEGAEQVANQAVPSWKPDIDFFREALGFRIGSYGMTQWSQLFTSRQLLALSTSSGLVQEARQQVDQDLRRLSLANHGKYDQHSTSYADAIALYLGLAVSKLADYNGSLVQWSTSRDQAVHVFGRQALPMVWDYAEVNPFARAAGDLATSLGGMCRVIELLGYGLAGHAWMAEAQGTRGPTDRCVSTDPPYYDNVGYADLSDYFYVWLRRSLRFAFGDLLATLTVPKVTELVATPARHGGAAEAQQFFVSGMTQALENLAEQAHPGFPLTIYYAFKQSEADSEAGVASTGWETFLNAIIDAGLAIGGTWPVRTEKPGRMRENSSNALASSIVLVCRARAQAAPTAAYGELRSALRAELPVALSRLQSGNVAPVDLAQAAIGPGFAVFTRYARVLDAAGRPLTIRQALALINETLDEILAQQESEFDSETRWALAWFSDHGFGEGPFGEAHTYFVRFNTAENALVGGGIAEAGHGRVRLLRPEEMQVPWVPETDPRLTVWGSLHHLIREFSTGGEFSAATLLARLGTAAEAIRDLCYRLYTLCERSKRSAEAQAYNALVLSWPEISRLARESAARPEAQGVLL
jgi:putative DNA methylase